MEDQTIDLTWLITFLTPYIEVILAAFIGWVAFKVKAYLGVNIEAQHREALHSALMTGVNAALDRISANGKLTLRTRNKVLALAADYARQAVPDAIRYFGLTEDRLRIMLEAKLNEHMSPPAPSA